MAGKKGPKLNTASDVSRFLAKLIRETYRGSMDHERAGKLAYMCNALRASLEASDLEDRIRKLESVTKGQP